MANVNQLKNQARREEQRENWSRAIELYTQALDASRKESQGFVDLSLYNRIGDIYLRIGQKNTAVRYYEQAIELYAEQDLHTSAIALCNKVLRILPDRSTVFLQLGRLNLATSLVAEGREHYHRYATAMRKRGSEEAALEGLEELIVATGDSGTLTLWAGWLAEASDAEASVARIEALREALERHGIDPEEVAAQVRSKTVVGFEDRAGDAKTADPLAGAFLTLGDEPPPKRAREPAPASAAEEPSIDPDELEPERIRPAASHESADDLEAESPSYDESDDEGGAREPVQPGSIPWEQEAEEIIAEFDLPDDDLWSEDPTVEEPDVTLEPGREPRRGHDLEALEIGAGSRHTDPHRSPGESAEWDELEYAAADVRVHALEVEVQEGLDADAPESAPEGPESADLEPEEALEPVVGDGPVVGEAFEPVVEEAAESAGGGVAAPTAPDRPETASGVSAEAGTDREDPGEAPERAFGPRTEATEPVFSIDTDELESIVRAAADLGESGGFEVEPALEDELPDPDAEEPSEQAIDPAAVLATGPAATVPQEPPDVEVAGRVEAEVSTGRAEREESFEAPGAGPPRERESIGMERDEEGPSIDESAWLDDARHALDRHARADAEAAASRNESAIEEPDAPTGEVGPEADESGLEAETIAIEWADDAREEPRRPGGGQPTPDSEPVAGTVPPARPEPEPVAGAEPAPVAEAEPEPVAELEPPAPRPAAPRGRVANGRRAGGAGSGRDSLDGEPVPPLAEPRLQVEEDPEDAFRDWVESASMGILKRALQELEHRQEHERALVVIARLTRLEETAVEFKIRQVEYLSALGRTEEALEACVALGARLEAWDRPVEARDAYRRAETLAPGDEQVIEALQRLEGVEEDSMEEAVVGPGPKRPYMPDHVNGADRGSVIDRPIPTISVTVEDRGMGPRPYSGVAGGSEAGTDFEQLLSEFRAELHEKPAHNDSSSRTELGARLKEMGRLDDAIRELQGAVREPSAPPLAFELLGEAFLEKGQPRIAVRFLEKALGSLSQGDRDILGVLYQLGIAYEALNDLAKALICYERIFSVDIDYRDIQERILSCSV